MEHYLKDKFFGGLVQIKWKEKETLFREKYFYSNHTSTEIKAILDLNYRQYKRLLKRAKAYYNLPPSYRRQPHKYWKYDKDSFYILKINNHDFEILGYYPREEFAKTDFEEHQYNEDIDYIYCIEKATDVNLKRLLEFGYFTLQWNWETLINKTHIPYHKFYKLLREVKRKNKMNSNHTDRYIYYIDGEYRVSRTFDGRQKSFGMYPNKEYARLVRDYLERIGWDVELWEECRVRFLFE